MAKDREQFGGGHRKNKRHGIRPATQEEVDQVDDLLEKIAAERKEAKKKKKQPDERYRIFPTISET